MWCSSFSRACLQLTYSAAMQLKFGPICVQSLDYLVSWFEVLFIYYSEALDVDNFIRKQWERKIGFFKKHAIAGVFCVGY
jgi:hypothetical protein